MTSGAGDLGPHQIRAEPTATGNNNDSSDAPEGEEQQGGSISVSMARANGRRWPSGFWTEFNKW